MVQLFPPRLLVIFSVFLLSLTACHKDNPTILKGTVVDKITGMPLDSVLIELRINNDTNAALGTASAYLVTDENGKFEFNHETPFSIYSANKTGYLLSGAGLGTVFPKINSGETNDVVVKITPLDGFLKLILKNNGPSNKIHVGIYSPLQEANYGLTFGLAFRDSFYVEQSTETQRVVRLASNETINVYWGLSPQPYNLKNLPIQGTVDITRNDTSSFTITF